MSTNSTRRGFTLIDLLIVMAILGVLIQLSIPAVQLAREAARRSQCANNLRQIALAFQEHHDALHHLPTGGWGWKWTGNPDRGFDQDQTGGWCYNILPYIGEQAIRDLGAKLPEGSTEKLEAIFQANTTPVPLFNCPTRRLPRSFPTVHLGFSYLLPQRCREGGDCPLARNDYAANGGDIQAIFAKGKGADGPPTYDEAATWKWERKKQSGVVYQRSMIRFSDIPHGLSKTYCVGEKFIPPMHYATGMWVGDDNSLYAGHDYDTIRHSGNKPYAQPPYFLPPKQDTDDFKFSDRGIFGSAHPDTFNMAFCDGSVMPIRFDIDPEVHALSGARDEAIWNAAHR